MIYTEMTCKAARIAYKAHEGAYDACGLPYIMHPLHVAEQMTTETATAAALLHDVVEDTDITLDDLRAEGFSEEIINVVDLLTHREEVPYDEYLARIKTNPAALAVKLADIAHNSDESRFSGAAEPVPPEWIEHWRRKYAAAIKLLTDDSPPDGE